MGITLFGAASYVVVNLVVDVAPGVARPAHPARLMAIAYTQLPAVVSERRRLRAPRLRAFARDPLAHARASRSSLLAGRRWPSWALARALRRARGRGAIDVPSA